MKPNTSARVGALVVLVATLLAPTPALAAQVGTPELRTVDAAPLDQTVRFRGTVRPRSRVEVQRLTEDRGWVRTATARADRQGRYLARWRADELGRFTLRAITRRGARSAVAGPTAPAAVQVTIFRQVRATYYGPGLYGNRTACGQELTPDLMGVAHRTLPCGTPVELFHDGRTVLVPVVDRGPFANGAHYDLTEAVGRALDFLSTGDVGVLPRRGETMDPPPAPDRAVTGPGGGTAAPAGDTP